VPLGKPRYPFTRRMIDGAPGDAGVYLLYAGARVLYIGRAADLRARLQQHLEGAVCECSRLATHYSWEIVLQPQVRELELLREQRERDGALPPCNRHAASA
jgi:predicted GIY-YIG superfamily endonuclease